MPLSFRKGTKARKARGLIVEDLKSQGSPVRGNVFAIGTDIYKRASPAGKKRLQRRGLF